MRLKIFYKHLIFVLKPSQLFTYRGKRRKSKEEVKQEIIKSIIERERLKTNFLNEKADKLEKCQGAVSKAKMHEDICKIKRRI